jgi:hypothetical protein
MAATYYEDIRSVNDYFRTFVNRWKDAGFRPLKTPGERRVSPPLYFERWIG